MASIDEVREATFEAHSACVAALEKVAHLKRRIADRDTSKNPHKYPSPEYDEFREQFSDVGGIGQHDADLFLRAISGACASLSGADRR